MLSWNEVVERGKQHNKTVICEVEKRGNIRRFKIKCEICGYEKESSANEFHRCIICYNNLEIDRCILKENFILRAKEIHGDKFNYDLVEYVNRNTKVIIKCNECQSLFSQVPSGHLLGYGCSICYHSKIRCSIEDFINKAIKIHNDKFNYDLVEYVNSQTKVKILCNTCSNVFDQKPNDHLQGYGCKICADNILKSNTKDFINKAIKIHNDKFNYDLVEYKKSNSFVKIKCNNCNEFFLQSPNTHLRMKQNVCYKCSNKFTKISTEEWVERAKKIHKQRFDYDQTIYKNNKGIVSIRCNKCNSFFYQRADHHLRGNGCPRCKESKGEIKVTQYLTEKKISFIPQKTFDSLRYVNPLKYDFYIPDINSLIEYDGEGHYRPCFGSTPEEKQKNLKDCQRRDKIKNEWARKNNIPLLRIPYWDYDRIEELIEAFILEHRKLVAEM